MIEKTQDELDEYLKNISDKENCKYMENVHGIMHLCNAVFSCKFQEKGHFIFHSSQKHECKRPHYLKLKRIL
jgi:hypothetical protein